MLLIRRSDEPGYDMHRVTKFFAAIAATLFLAGRGRLFELIFDGAHPGLDHHDEARLGSGAVCRARTLRGRHPDVASRGRAACGGVVSGCQSRHRRARQGVGGHRQPAEPRAPSEDSGGRSRAVPRRRLRRRAGQGTQGWMAGGGLQPRLRRISRTVGHADDAPGVLGVPGRRSRSRRAVPRRPPRYRGEGRGEIE